MTIEVRPEITPGPNFLLLLTITYYYLLDYLTPLAVQRASIPLQTSAFFWNPSAITTFTFFFVIPTGVRSTEGTFETPLSVVQLVLAFLPFIKETARSAAPCASALIAL